MVRSGFISSFVSSCKTSFLALCGESSHASLDYPNKSGNDKFAMTFYKTVCSSLVSLLVSSFARLSVNRFNQQTSKPANQQTQYGFTLIEILIVITIIAILATTMIPNFIGFDVEARVSATQTNLNSLRTRITLFRAKEGGYPEELEELLTVTYDDMGVKKPYLDRIPSELMSSKKGNNSVENLTSDEEPSGEGGWVYFRDKADVIVNITEPLSSKWGSYAEQKPSEW